MRMRICFCLAFLLIFFWISFHQTFAQVIEDKDLADGVYLAYIKTGDADADQTSQNGLTALAKILKLRTTIDVKGVQGVNPDQDALAYYPFLYWPMTAEGTPLSSITLQALQKYMAEGGILWIDTRDGGDAQAGGVGSGTRALRQISRDLDIPELVKVDPQHILAKSFYLLNVFPGRFAEGNLWVEREPSQNNDAVTSIVIGSADYAAAWSQDPQDRRRFDIVPGGERQRELAYRVGVNITMAALAGNYKSDQIHVPYILERLGK